MTPTLLPQTPTSISIGCVVYDTAFDTLSKTIKSLFASLKTAQENNLIQDYQFFLINNQIELTSSTRRAFALATELMGGSATLISGHGNLGYGKGNNLAINRSNSQFHLILNPDVEMEPHALMRGIQFLQSNLNAGVVAPTATNENGEPEYLAKRNPDLPVILVRGLNKPLLNKLFRKSLDSYAYKDKYPFVEPMEIELASGCFMLCRMNILKQVDGFSQKYFLYFEDFDLSRRISQISKLYLVPQVQIIHLGGKLPAKVGNI
jgi:GT2 family glycosyltransferase